MHQRLFLPSVPGGKTLPGLILAVALTMAMFVALLVPSALAAPGESSNDNVLNQNVDYLGPENAATLALDFPVLVPSYVPGPFSGEPAVDAGSGSYSLYWMNAGGAPTFLLVSGLVGGALPAGSPADLNNELSVNATVQGYAAIHDVTETYDAVWWIVGGVMYSVESRNMGTDSLSLANSLVPFVAPEPQAPEVEAPMEELPPDAGGGILETPTDVPELPDEATDPGVDGGEEPVATSDVVEEPADTVDPAPEITVESAAEPTVQPAQTQVGPTAESQEAPTPEPTAEPIDESQETVELDEEDSGVDESTVGRNAGSDGTGGASLPVFGGDGTGGTRDLVVPDPDE